MWRPNVHNKKLWSNHLGRFVQVKVVARVLRTIDKLGGLDEYLVGNDSPARIKDLGVTGWALRWRVMQTKGYRDRAAAERRRLGLPERGWEVEELERRKRERREALRVAEAYLDAAKAEGSKARKRAVSVVEAVEQAAENTMEVLGTATQEQEDAEKELQEASEDAEREESKKYVQERSEEAAANSPGTSGKFEEGLEMTGDPQEPGNGIERSNESPASKQDAAVATVDERLNAAAAPKETADDIFEPEFDVEDEEPLATAVQPGHPATKSTAPAITPPSASEQLFAQLSLIASQIHTTPELLIKAAQVSIRNRTKDLAASKEERAQRTSERATIISAIEAALASPQTWQPIQPSQRATRRRPRGKRPPA